LAGHLDPSLERLGRARVRSRGSARLQRWPWPPACRLPQGRGGGSL